MNAAEPMTVLITSDTIGGVWTYSMTLARVLENRGVRFHLATMGEPLTPSQRREVEQLGHVTLHESCFPLEWMEQPWTGVDRAAAWLRFLEVETSPDLIHLNGYSHGAIRFQAPVLIVAHSCVGTWWSAVKREPLPDEWQEYRVRIERGLRRADYLVAPTAALLEAMEKQYDFAIPREVIWNATDGSDFRCGEKQPLVFSAGRMWDEAKNLGILVEASARFDWPLYVAGAGSDGISIRGGAGLGRLDPEDLRRWLSRASIYAFPALYEPFGLSVLEAAHAGCALVLSDIPTLREVWSDAAIYCDPRDSASVARAVQRLILDEDARVEMAHRASERAKTFSLDRFGGAYLELYRALVGDGTGKLAARTVMDLEDSGVPPAGSRRACS
jgi:glycogen synthase